MGRFLLAKAVLDGVERFSVIAESALPHLPAWTAVDASDIRENPWDFEQPDDTAKPAAAVDPTPAVEPTAKAATRPSGRTTPNPDNQPLPSKES